MQTQYELYEGSEEDNCIRRTTLDTPCQRAVTRAGPQVNEHVNPPIVPVSLYPPRAVYSSSEGCDTSTWHLEEVLQPLYNVDECAFARDCRCSSRRQEEHTGVFLATEYAELFHQRTLPQQGEQSVRMRPLTQSCGSPAVRRARQLLSPLRLRSMRSCESRCA